MNLSNYVKDRDDAAITAIRSWDPLSAIEIGAGLLLYPPLHANSLRLEALVHLLVMYASGNITPTLSQVVNLLNGKLFRPIAELEENPTEVFVHNLYDFIGNYEICTADWVNPQFYSQQLLTLVNGLPEIDKYNQFKCQTRALISLSHWAVARAKLSRYDNGGGTPGADFIADWSATLPVLTNAVRFSISDLEHIKITQRDLQPFIFEWQSRHRLGQDWLGNSLLESAPILKFEDQFVLALPSAISASLRRFIVGRCAEMGDLEKLAQALRLSQEHTLFNEAHYWRGAENISVDLPQPPKILDWITPHCVRFDETRAAILLLLHDDLEAVLQQGLTRPNEAALPHLSDLQNYLDALIGAIGTAADSGVVVWVTGGVGRGFAMPLLKSPESWWACHISLSDLLDLSWTEDEWITALWKTRAHAIRAKHLGMDLAENDLIAVFSYERYEGRMIPLDFPTKTSSHSVAIDRGYIKSFRGAARINADDHAIFRHSSNKWTTGRKLFQPAHFRELAALPIYAAIKDAHRGRLSGVVETEHLTLWIHAGPRPTVAWQRSLLYQLWEGALQWAAKVCFEIEGDQASNNINCELLLDVAELENWKEPLATTLPNSSPLQLHSTNSSPFGILRVGLGFFKLLSKANNIAERRLALSVLKFLKLAGALNKDASLPTILSRVVPDNGARFIHFIPALNVRDQLAINNDLRPRPPRLPDHSSSLAGSSWEVLTPGPSVTLEGISNCNHFLHEMVDVFWKRISDRLHQLDRASVLRMCLFQHEATDSDRRTWRRTSRALLTVYRDRQDILSAAGRHEVALSEAGISSRALAEMAVCDAVPENGKRITHSDFDELCSDLLSLVMAAYDSDAVVRGVIFPKIDISPNGEFKTGEDFYDGVLKPYQSGSFQDTFEASANAYDDLYRVRQPKRVDEVFSPEFLNAFEAEYSVSVEDLVNTDVVLSERAGTRNEVVTQIGADEFQLLLTSRAKISNERAASILQHFCLWPRDSWDKTPKGFRRKDWEPWRFRRRLSLLSRPLMRLRNQEPSDVLFAAGLVHQGFAYVVEGCLRGNFETEFFASPEMQTWVGKVNNREGHAFNKLVADRLSELGWRAKPDVSMSIFGRPDLGDCDVIAWNPETALIYLAECKKLKHTLTVTEIAEQLVRFRGETRDDLGRHLDRVTWLRENPKELHRLVGSLNADVVIRPLLVTNTIVPMNFQKDLPLTPDLIVPFKQLAELRKL